jgi:hypothetical protein
MLTNTTKAKLADGEAVFGCFFRYAEPSLAEYVAMLGWDFSSRRRARMLDPRTWRACCAAELRG